MRNKLKVFVVCMTFFLISIECSAQSITLFFGDFEKGSLYEEERHFEKLPTEEIASFMTRLLKAQSEKQKDAISSIPNDAKVLGVTIEPKLDAVQIDLSYEYEQMGYGSLGEYLALHSLAYTIGYYYNVDYVIITVEGKPYESGHFYFQSQEGISLTINKEEVMRQ